MPQKMTISLGKEITRNIGRAIYDFSMIREGDRILVGLSGGKDSGILLCALRRLQSRSPIAFELGALTVDPGDEGTDLSQIREMALVLGVRHHEVHYPMFKVLASAASDSPCSLCANIRRGILASAANELGYDVLALGHHCDDAVETVWLNLMYAGRFRCFHPHMTMSRSGVRVIRPMVYVREETIAKEAARLALPRVDFGCPHSENSKRALVKEKIRDLSAVAPNMVGNILHALKHCRKDDVWSLEEVLR